MRDKVIEPIHGLLFHHFLHKRRSKNPGYFKSKKRAEDKAERGKEGAKHLAVNVAANETRYLARDRSKDHLECLEQNEDNFRKSPEGKDEIPESLEAEKILEAEEHLPPLPLMVPIDDIAKENENEKSQENLGYQN